MKKPIISIWGFGPSYRNRIKQNIQQAIDTGYDNIMDYVILTDYPDDFYELSEKTGKIKAIINIHDVREDYEWSKNVEFIPMNMLDPKEYGDEYNRNLSERKMFSYSLHRFSFPTISKLGYNKIVFMDCDVKIEYEKIGNEMTEDKFWDEFNTPINSMKACWPETVYVDSNNKFNFSYGIGESSSLVTLQLSSIVLNKLYENHNEFKNPLITTLTMSEGPFRYYHFDSSEKVLEYFKIWDETLSIILTNNILKNVQQCGGYMLCDYIPVAITNIFHNIEVLIFHNTIYKRQIYFEDRYFIPPNVPGLSEVFIKSDSSEDFIEKNKRLKELMEKNKAWPHVERR